MERWSRNCGSGVGGPIGAATEFIPGVLVHNWVENASISAHPDVLGIGSNFTETSTQRHSYNPAGKTGVDLLDAGKRTEYGQPALKGEQLLRHGEFGQEPLQCHATLNQLTYGEKRFGEPQVQEYLWQGYKQNDRQVPLSTVNLSATAIKAQQWQDDAGADPYATSTRSAAMAAALPSAGAVNSTLRAATLGRDGLGSAGGTDKGFTKELDKTYNKSGLRGNYY